MSRRLRHKPSRMTAGRAAALLVSLLMVCPLAAQDFDSDLAPGDPPLHSKVSSGQSGAIQPTGRSGGTRGVRLVQFEEEIAPGAPYHAMSPDDGGYLPGPAGALAGPQLVGPNCCPPIVGAVCDPCTGVSQERRWYMERHFGPGSVAQADGMSRFEASYSCIDNNFYAPVAPPSPCMPLGGDSPFPDSWTSWLHKTPPPADPQNDPNCPDVAPAPQQSANPWFPGTGWYPNGSPCYLGNCFDKHGGCCGKFCSWIWKHNTAQYMWENFHLFAGPQGFKSPTDLFQDGNFGFHEGLNWGMPVWDDIGLGYQKGFQVTQNNLNGGTGAGIFNHYRSQVFVTAGLFHRPIAGVGLQGGAAIDWLDDHYYASTNLTQVRAEISYLGQNHNEIGFWGSQHLNSSSGISPFTLQPTTFQATNQYNIFVRRNFASGASGRLWGGITGGGDGLFGGDATIYFSDRWALNSAFNYLIPKGNSAVPATLREDLALTINLMWWPGYRTPASRYNPYRQLFSVADNTTFLITPK